MVHSAWWCSLVLVGSFLLTASDGTGQPPPTSAESGIVGLVQIGPNCPVVQSERPCPDRPFAASIMVTHVADGRQVLTVHSGQDGTFRVPLAPGTYRLVPHSPNPGAPPYAEPQTVTVEAGQYVSVVIKYDSGIR
jgi:hypothetical protein